MNQSSRSANQGDITLVFDLPRQPSIIRILAEQLPEEEGAELSSAAVAAVVAAEAGNVSTCSCSCTLAK
jgi:hypothetical protein